jgi:mRNA-degrading endonuclease RelE of RelBE toxin-antitoxin system
LPYEVEFDPIVQHHFQYLTARERAWVMDEVWAQLTYEPLVGTRNRKRLRPNTLATWELRVGDLRIFYDVFDTHVVRILAVGRKRGNVVIIAGREITL